MLVAVADTHAVLWYLFADPRLSIAARNFITQAATQGDQIGISSVTLAEVVYLQEKGHIHNTSLQRIIGLFRQPNSAMIELPFDRHVAIDMMVIPRPDVPDMPDRMIAATALHHQVPVISRDSKIQASSIQTIW